VATDRSCHMPIVQFASWVCILFVQDLLISVVCFTA